MGQGPARGRGRAGKPDSWVLRWLCLPSRLAAAELEQVEEMDFRSLVPTTTSRGIASRIFYLCLGERSPAAPCRRVGLQWVWGPADWVSPGG